MTERPHDPQTGPRATRWSMLDGLDDRKADEAWAWFVNRYRPMVRAVLARRLGPGAAGEALDDFWAYLFTHRITARADRRLRFRTFLCAVVHRYAQAWRRRHSLDGAAAEPVEPVRVDVPPDDHELAAWAHNVLALALSELRAEHSASADLLQWSYGVAVDGSAVEPIGVPQIAERTGLKPATIHVALHRARRRLRARIEAELRESGGDGDVAEELGALLRALGASRSGMVEHADG